MSRPAFVVLGSLILVATTISCGEDTPTSPTPTPPANVIETFSGTLGKNAATSYTFTASATGSVTATLTAVGPDAKGTDDLPLVVGFGIGTWSNPQCTVLLAQDRAIQGSVILGNVNASGTLCVRIFDVGNVVDQVDYTINVSHP